MVTGGYASSVRDVVDARPADVVILGADGLPVFGFNPSRPGTAVLTSVASSVTSVILLASNAARRKFAIVNDSTKTLRVAFAATASATAYTALLPAGASMEGDLDGYTGDISGIWASANGNARITEIT